MIIRKIKKSIKINLVIIGLAVLIISCNKKNIYNSTAYNVIGNDSTKVDISYDSINSKIDFELKNKLIVGQISNDTTLLFSNKKISSKKLELNSDNISFDININGKRYYVFGTKLKSNPKNYKLNDSLKLKIKYELINEKTIQERQNLTSKDIEEYIKLETTRNFNFSYQDKVTVLKEGDIVVLFDDYYKTDKIVNDYFKPLYDTKKGVLQKKPIMVVFHKFEGTVTGNRFRDGGLSENQVGYTYSYGNYEKEVKYLEVRFISFDLDLISSRLDTYGYLYYFEKDSLEWKKTYEGLQNFISNEYYTDEKDNIFFKKNIIDKIFNCEKKYKSGIFKNDGIIWNNNNDVALLFKNFIN